MRNFPWLIKSLAVIFKWGRKRRAGKRKGAGADSDHEKGPVTARRTFYKLRKPLFFGDCFFLLLT